MKKSITLVIFFLQAFFLTAQYPQAFKYQAIARDEAGNALSICDIGLRVKIVQKDTDLAVYVETHKVQTNVYGLINLMIGEGKTEKGEFSNIKWGDHKHYLKIEMDIDGGENYKEMGSSQLSAVPYALYAAEAGKISDNSNETVAPEAKNPKPNAKSQQPTENGNKNSRNGTPNTKMSSDGDSFVGVTSGNLGVGTSAPAEKLHVMGNLLATGNVTAGNHMVIYDEGGNPREMILKADGTLAFWFLCKDKMTDPRDGKTYKIKKIGNQCWMTENLDVGIRIDGITDPGNNSVIEKYCYDDADNNCDIYGGMYLWNEAMGYVTTEGAQGICPTGWHIPTDGEWKLLEGNVDSFYGVGDVEWDSTGWHGMDVGLNLKSVSGWQSGGNGTDLYGFAALPGGYYEINNDLFSNLYKRGYYWTSTKPGGLAFYRFQDYNKDDRYRGTLTMNLGFSIRCLKDFECGDSLTDYRDWKTYGTVTINNRCWMKENLNIGTRIDPNTYQDNDGTIEKYCYDDIEANCDTLGGLYMWDEAMNYTTIEGDQGICPPGWHIPTFTEYEDMAISLGGINIAGGKLKSTGTIQTGTGLWEDPNTAATNESGFSALPGGHVHGVSVDKGTEGKFWTSEFFEPDHATGVFLNYQSASILMLTGPIIYGKSVRCIKDL
jgi:uncharacterized protein (TIGR02145 family)